MRFFLGILGGYLTVTHQLGLTQPWLKKPIARQIERVPSLGRGSDMGAIFKQGAPQRFLPTLGDSCRTKTRFVGKDVFELLETQGRAS